MQSRQYYEDQATRARRLAQTVHQGELADLLTRIAEDYEDIADDLDNGAIAIRHPELLKQPGRDR